MTKKTDEEMLLEVKCSIDATRYDRAATKEENDAYQAESDWVDSIYERAKQPVNKMFLCDSLKGHWPVGGEVIVVAPDIDTAVQLLQRQVELEGLPQQTVVAAQLAEVPFATPKAIIIKSGDY